MILRLLIIASLVLSAVGLGTLGFQLLMPAPHAATEAAAPAPPPLPARARFLVATRALSAGTLLKDEDFAVRELPPEQVPDGVLEPGDEIRAELRGGLLKQYLDAGAPVRRGDVLRPRDRGFLAAVLRPGARAISVGVDVVTGTAGLIWPGDQVDLILTQELPAAEAPLSRRIVGETLLADVRVIAVDQQFTQGATAADATPNRIARTITLEVLPEQAERVAVGSRLGRIALTVRAIEAAAAMAFPKAASVFGGDVSPALARSSVSDGIRMRVIEGDGQPREVTFR
ncbi:Flp pilus assembly protein CpaB [Siccirubricoccus sp. KC 17139]|uniref:Flp pilus assembly protein CpaB n=1 Tax=Siccirubricoccus soli TaxID=2899147 RepID=A0ABT1DBA7_9PROT|nr:Flp pilus assembly protein CpaB [Siccirubricoccus soli]MCO6419231.1 Flp pilus assembly protein CpaB [Siccirubricoccus soli]MCP2685366.1 Flp pilus assembly protein CpaB [Siccirubricoccus soli]